MTLFQFERYFYCREPLSGQHLATKNAFIA